MDGREYKPQSQLLTWAVPTWHWFQAPLADVTPEPFLENGEHHQGEQVLLHKPRVTVESAGAGFYHEKHQKLTLPRANPV